MSGVVLAWSLTGAQAMLAVAMGLATWRMLHGPRAQDRILALDSFYLSGMLVLLMFGIQTARTVYFEAAVIVALLGFVSTAALAKFIMRGEVIE